MSKMLRCPDFMPDRPACCDLIGRIASAVMIVAGAWWATCRFG
jgi:hypothetical protein